MTSRHAAELLFLCLLQSVSVAFSGELQFPRNEAEWVRALARPQFKGYDACAKGIRIAPDLRDLCEPRAGLEVLFEIDSSRILAEYGPVLDELGRSLRRGLADAVLVIQGHADSSGSADHNLVLSVQRARAVRAYLVERHGIEPERLRFEGYGEERPRADNGTEAGRRLNRSEVVRIGSVRED